MLEKNFACGAFLTLVPNVLVCSLFRKFVTKFIRDDILMKIAIKFNSLFARNTLELQFSSRFHKIRRLLAACMEAYFIHADFTNASPVAIETLRFWHWVFQKISPTAFDFLTSQIYSNGQKSPTK